MRLRTDFAELRRWASESVKQLPVFGSASIQDLWLRMKITPRVDHYLPTSYYANLSHFGAYSKVLRNEVTLNTSMNTSITALHMPSIQDEFRSKTAITYPVQATSNSSRAEP